jgi:hypothetical protein
MPKGSHCPVSTNIAVMAIAPSSVPATKLRHILRRKKSFSSIKVLTMRLSFKLPLLMKCQADTYAVAVGVTRRVHAAQQGSI